jgi:hypothetical protein
MNRLMQIPHWQVYKPFFNPLVAKLLVPWFALLPILLNFLHEVPRKVPILSEPTAFLTLALPFKWWLLWWSSFFYTLAIVVFGFRCPGFVKRYPDYSKYVEMRHSPRWIASELFYAVPKLGESKTKLFERLVTKQLASVADPSDANLAGSRLVETSDTSYWFDHNGKKYKVSASDGPTDNGRLEREVFWEIFEQLATSCRGSRMATLVLLLLAAVPFVLVVIQNIASVLPSAVKATAHAIGNWF